MPGIGLTDYIKPKNDAFTGIVQASQVLGGGGDGTLPDACVAASNVTQHEDALVTPTCATKIVTPKVEYTGVALFVDVIDGSNTSLAIGNSGAGVCNITCDGQITGTSAVGTSSIRLQTVTGQPGLTDNLGKLMVAATGVGGAAVNHVNLTNSATGGAVAIAPIGSDADINLTIDGKGDGEVVIDGRSSSKYRTFQRIYKHNKPEGGDWEPMFSVPNGATITRVRAWTKAASGDTCSFELYECAELTCDDGDGVAIMGAAMVADDTGEIKTAAFDNAGLAQYAWVCVDITATTGAPDFIWIAVTYVIDED